MLFCSGLWPSSLLSLLLSKGCSEEQKKALMEIRNSTNGVAFADWDVERDCCNQTYEIACGGIAGGVSIIYLDMALPRTWYPNVTLFTMFDELEELSLFGMQIGGGLQRENSNLICSCFFFFSNPMICLSTSNFICSLITSILNSY
jgi:hypothetical protein